MRLNIPKNHKAIAFIPARSGSKRVIDKNIRLFEGHPLLAYSIRAAIDSNIFDKVVCVTDSQKYADIAKYYGAEVPALRPSEISGELSPDIDWVLWILEFYKANEFKIFSILRPTSPFRSVDTIKRAWKVFIEQEERIGSLRAVEKCQQHPGKMWVMQGNVMTPIMPFSKNGVPWHSNQYKALPEVYVQNACLEFSWIEATAKIGNISGDVIAPFFTAGLEGFDINTEEDWVRAVTHVEEQKSLLHNLRMKEM
jgi:N-acylneuraminate cytidylyltransferase